MLYDRKTPTINCIFLKKKYYFDKSHSLQQACAQRRSRLEEARNFYLFLEDYDNEVFWLVEKQRICKTGISAKDLRAVVSLQQKHKALEDEIKVREPKSTQMIDAGRKLISENHLRQAEIKNRVESLQEHWKSLQELVDLRRRQLEDASEAYQFYTDANEAESWLNEKITLLESKDYGVDEPSGENSNTFTQFYTFPYVSVMIFCTLSPSTFTPTS